MTSNLNKKLSPKTVVLFDLDGTLVDSVPDLAMSIDHMMAEVGHPPCGEDRVRHYIGDGATRLIERALTGQMDKKPVQAEYQRAHKLFFDHYAKNVCQKSVLYPGALQALQELDSDGYALCCVTNKPGLFTLPLLQALGIDSFFKLVLSGDTLQRKKPDPLPLIHAAKEMKAEIGQVVMVGDSKNDIIAAKSAGMDSIAVTYGYNHGTDIALSNPDRVVDNLNQLSSILKK